MNEEAAFLQALNETPDDLSLRMVFADWLEERGDPRGELLRLTHTLTQSVDVPQRAELEARMQTLVDEGTQAIGPFRTNSVGMSFAWIPPGTFLMGSPKGEEARIGDETQHTVLLSKGFFLGIHQVTQIQWETVMENTPSHFKGKQLPVEMVSWDNCILFCERLGKLEGQKYRLPTEAEWEYACRAGAATALGFGINAVGRGESAWYSPNASQTTHAVGQKKPNALGLYDMYGNVWEWCNDWYGDYPSREVANPRGPATGTARVMRGGSWSADPWLIRIALRSASVPSYTRNDVGLRVCFDVD